jgi:hypothetical protein
MNAPSTVVGYDTGSRLFLRLSEDMLYQPHTTKCGTAPFLHLAFNIEKNFNQFRFCFWRNFMIRSSSTPVVTRSDSILSYLYCAETRRLATNQLLSAMLLPTKKLHGLSPRANCTDQATAACGRSDCQLLQIEGATWSAWRIPRPYSRFSRQEPLLFYQVAQSYSRGWVDPVSDQLLFFW